MTSRHLQLQQRDLEILDALCTWGPLDTDSITKGWFTTHGKATRRMSRLVEAGHCRRVLIARNLPAIYHVGSFTAQTQHRAAVNRVRIELWGSGRLVEFEPEVEFAGSQHRADALVTWGSRDGPVTTFFVEVDRGTETFSQIRQKMQGYRQYFSSLRWQRLWQHFPPIVWVATPDRLAVLERWLHGHLPQGMQCVFGLTTLRTTDDEISKPLGGALKR